MWGVLDQRLRKRPKPRNAQELVAAMHEEWVHIPRYHLCNVSFTEVETWAQLFKANDVVS